MEVEFFACNSVGVYKHALTRGKHYEILDQDENKYRIIGDHGRRIWIDREFFNEGIVLKLL